MRRHHSDASLGRDRTNHKSLYSRILVRWRTPHRLIAGRSGSHRSGRPWHAKSSSVEAPSAAGLARYLDSRAAIPRHRQKCSPAGRFAVKPLERDSDVGSTTEGVPYGACCSRLRDGPHNGWGGACLGISMRIPLETRQVPRGLLLILKDEYLCFIPTLADDHDC
jgi:hypothetical protein